MKLMPASSAAWMIRMLSSWSGLPQAPNIIAPRHSGDTLTPVRPSGRWVMRRSLRGLGQRDLADHRGGEIGEQLDLVLGPLARVVVDHAQRAERVAVGIDERHARVGDRAHLL